MFVARKQQSEARAHQRARVLFVNSVTCASLTLTDAAGGLIVA